MSVSDPSGLSPRRDARVVELLTRGRWLVYLFLLLLALGLVRLAG